MPAHGMPVHSSDALLNWSKHTSASARWLRTSCLIFASLHDICLKPEKRSTLLNAQVAAMAALCRSAKLASPFHRHCSKAHSEASLTVRATHMRPAAWSDRVVEAPAQLEWPRHRLLRGCWLRWSARVQDANLCIEQWQLLPRNCRQDFQAFRCYQQAFGTLAWQTGRVRVSS